MIPLAALLATTAFLTGCAVPDANARRGDQEHHGHSSEITEPKAEIAPVLDIPLDPSAGREIGLVFESYLSPQQEAGEEADTPGITPDVFKSTEPSTPREERDSRGHGIVAFSRDFSRAYVQLAIENIDPDDIVMAHLHCGKPGQLGPIIVDFGSTGSLSEYFADGRLDYELTNRDLERTIEGGEGIVGAFTAGCPIILARPGDRIRTLSGMAVVAEEGELYFNIHTKSQTFYGDIRGQLYPVAAPTPAQP